MKTKLLLFFFCLSVLSSMGQGTITRNKCKTCGKVVSQCPHKGKHPKPQQEKPKQEPKKEKNKQQTEKKCKECGKVISQCEYNGNHPKPQSEKSCKECGKPLSLCIYGGKHPQPEEAGYDVTFTCNVPSANLSIDGIASGNVSSSRFLKTGTHTIRLNAEGYENYSRTITVNRQNRSFHFAMTEKEELATYQNEVLRVGNVSYRMKYVSGGIFTMGATSEMKRPLYWENPTHQVTLNSYYIGETEVTQALWNAVMGSNPSYFKGDNLPVEGVSWDNCQTFISKLNSLTGKRFRLPTEAEWEFAARGGKQSRHTQFSGSSRINDVAWYDGNSGDKPHPVKTKQPNELGIYDMSGNVWEWCQDWYGSYNSYAQTNPTGASTGSLRVRRGGSWGDSPGVCRSSNRFSGTPDSSYSGLGLRLVLSE